MRRRVTPSPAPSSVEPGPAENLVASFRGLTGLSGLGNAFFRRVNETLGAKQDIREVFITEVAKLFGVTREDVAALLNQHPIRRPVPVFRRDHRPIKWGLSKTE